MDIFLDQYCKAWLIEVNQSPSLLTESPLDYAIKKNLCRDTLHMLNINNKKKNRYLREIKTEMASRLVGKHRPSQQEREALKAKKLRIKDKWENNNIGDFQNLYPLKRGISKHDDELQDRYELIYRKALEVYHE